MRAIALYHNGFRTGFYFIDQERDLCRRGSGGLPQEAQDSIRLVWGLEPPGLPRPTINVQKLDRIWQILHEDQGLPRGLREASNAILPRVPDTTLGPWRLSFAERAELLFQIYYILQASLSERQVSYAVCRE